MVAMVKKIIGKTKYLMPIYDSYQYNNSAKSFSGNSINNSNILIVTNLKRQSPEYTAINSVIATENTNNVYLGIREKNLTDKILIESGDNLIGMYDHIINICVVDEKILLSNFVKEVYTLLQTEANYFVGKVRYGTICTAVIYNKMCSMGLRAEVEAVSGLIEGLGIVMANHNIIESGIIATNSVPMDKVMKVLVYLSSKYGQILNGEVLFMDV